VNLYRFIEAEKAQQRTLKRACELLEVSRAAYYAHRAAIPSAKPTRGPRAATAHPRNHAELRRRGYRHASKRWPG
jgi:hypothetical protein